MAKNNANATPAKDKGLESAVLGAVSNAQATPGDAGINQGAVSAEAGSIAAEANKQGANLSPEQQPQLPQGDNAQDKDQYTDKGEDLGITHDYLEEHPVQNQEEMDFLVEQLKSYRAGTIGKPVLSEEKAAPEAKEDKTVIQGPQNGYGDDHIIAQHHKTKEQRPFTRTAWQNIGGNANVDGWREVVKTPPEVEGLKAKK